MWTSDSEGSSVVTSDVDVRLIHLAVRADMSVCGKNSGCLASIIGEYVWSEDSVGWTCL